MSMLEYLASSSSLPSLCPFALVTLRVVWEASGSEWGFEASERERQERGRAWRASFVRAVQLLAFRTLDANGRRRKRRGVVRAGGGGAVEWKSWANNARRTFGKASAARVAGAA